MKWLLTIADQLEAQFPDGEIVVSSGVSPSGTYHLGTLREVLTAEGVCRELRLRGRTVRHIHVSDDLDIFRKVPVDVDGSFSQYLGMPLCDVPSPGGKDGSYADYFLSDLVIAAEGLHLDMEIMRAHQKYREGYFTDAIERALENIPKIRQSLETISGRKLESNWSPVQVIENGRLKNRNFIRLEKESKHIVYEGSDAQESSISYTNGLVKLNWRIDWPARWWKLGVQAEPFGKDHATKGGSYDTGVSIAKNVFGIEAPLPIPYNFINKTGETKKMSKSAGDTLTAVDLLKILPPELIWFFILRFPPEKLLFFDTSETLIRLFDEFSELLSKENKTVDEERLIELCLLGVESPTVSRVPFTHLFVSYQSSLKDPLRSLDVMRRTEYAQIIEEDKETVLREFAFIDEWLNQWADDDVKFELVQTVNKDDFTEVEKQFMSALADKITSAPDDADGEWFHKAIYEFKTELEIEPKIMFSTLYRALIAKESGPRAGWFLSMLPREWLTKRLKLQ